MSVYFTATAIIVAAASLTCVAPKASADDCHVARVAFCRDCPTTVPVQVGKNNQCIIHLREPDGFEALQILSPPHHGLAGIEENSRPRPGQRSTATQIVYTPAKGYVGDDSFQFTATFDREGTAYNTTVTVPIEVHDYKEQDSASKYFDSIGAGANTEIVIKYTNVNTELSPKPGFYKNHYTIIYRLSSENKVSKVEFRNGVKSYSGSGLIGGNFSTADGSSAAGSSGAALGIDNGALIITQERQTYYIITKIKTDGRNSCSASISRKLKPGQNNFQYYGIGKDRPLTTASDIHDEDVECSIANLQ